MTLADNALSKKITIITNSMRQAWDPIGGGGIAELPVDEYAPYAPVIVAMFVHGASDREVALRLRRFEEEEMQLDGSDIESLVTVARALRIALESP